MSGTCGWWAPSNEWVWGAADVLGTVVSGEEARATGGAALLQMRERIQSGSGSRIDEALLAIESM